jgi:hypothetical protein
MVTVFFSYSHKDEDLRDELEIHLTALKRQGIIQTWHDRRILAGKDLDEEIDSNIETADIILLLVSPYFIASDYCYNIEMQRALKRHEDGESRVIPVILHPCEWHETPFGKLKATPTDGKPVSKYPNQHDAFLLIAKDIRRAADEISAKTEIETDQLKITQVNDLGKKPKSKITGKPRSSNLRVRRKFTDIERSKFIVETLNYLANFFENSLTELESRVSDIETEFRRIDVNHFTSAIYEKGNLIGNCKIWLASDICSSGEIRYSSSISVDDNSYNESLHIDDDGYILGLKATMGFHRSGYDSETLLSQEGGAEHFWSVLIEPLQ